MGRKGEKRKVSQGQKQKLSRRIVHTQIITSTHSSPALHREKKEFRRQCMIGQSSRLMYVIIHLSFLSQADKEKDFNTETKGLYGPVMKWFGRAR